MNVPNSNVKAGIQSLMKKEFTSLLQLFTLAKCEKDLLDAATKAICSFTNSMSGFYVSCPANVSGDDPIQMVVFGSWQPCDEYRRLSGNSDFKENRATFQLWASSFGWNDLSVPFEAHDHESKSSLIYCVPVRSGDNQLVGLLGLQNKNNPFLSPESEAIIVLLTTLNMRLASANGSFISEVAVIDKIVHDINGGLSIVGLQNELLDFSNVTYDFNEVRFRIKEGLVKIETAVNQLRDLSSILFDREEPSNFCSAKVALDAAVLITAAINTKSKGLSVKNTVDEDVVGMKAIVLFYLYLNFLHMWTNLVSSNPKDPVEMLAELKHESSDKKSLVLELFRHGTSPINFEMSELYKSNHGCFDSGLTTMSRFSVLNSLITFFGGSVTLIEQPSAQGIQISLPLVS